METQLTLILALVFLVLLTNILLAWLLYRTLARWARQATRIQRHGAMFVEDRRSMLEGAQLASSRATQWSAQIRSGFLDATHHMDRADNWLRYGLAKMDFQVDRVSGEINKRAEGLGKVISGPLYRTGAIVRGVNALLEILTLSRAHHVNRQHD